MPTQSGARGLVLLGVSRGAVPPDSERPNKMRMSRFFICLQAFFLLGADLVSAVKVCARQLADLQLALVLCKLNQANAPELITSILREELLPYAEQRQDSWLCCVAYLQLDEPQRALEALACRLAEAAANKDGAEDGSDRCGLRQASQIDPEVVTFHQQVVGQPRNKARLPGALMPGSLVFACSYAYAHRSCHTIAMETLCLPYRAGAGEGEDGRTFDSMAATQWRLLLAVRHAAALAEHLLCASSEKVRWVVVVGVIVAVGVVSARDTLLLPRLLRLLGELAAARWGTARASQGDAAGARQGAPRSQVRYLCAFACACACACACCMCMCMLHVHVACCMCMCMCMCIYESHI